jgi:hypothetical protein
MIQLHRLAADERPIPDAPVSASSKIIVNALVATVWQVATGVQKWGSWYDYLKNAKLDGPFAAGSRLTYGGLIKHDLAIAKVKEHELVMIYGKLSVYSAITRWDFSPVFPDQTSVTLSETSEGFMLGTLYSNEKLGQHLTEWLERLKAEAERQ